MKRLVLWILVLTALGAGGYFGWRWYQQRGSAGQSSYRTSPVKRGDVVSSISATGTVVPEDVVDIGAQVNGQIATFGTDTDGKPIDYRSTVVQGAVLATIDDSIYAAQVASDEASLAQAQASVKVGEAGRDQAKAKLDQSQRDWARAQKLGESRALSQADYDASRSAYEQATASLAVSEAQIVQANSQVAIAQASLQRSRRNLVYCTIRSPVNGVVIDRRVEIGQTVVSSLNAPSLFLLAKDLSRMQVLVQVNEADIGHVKPGAAVSFTADAFAGDTFTGEVRKVRLNATMTQNVVTYTVEITTDNSSMKLLPYLTANVRFMIDRREQVLTVPNAALRWSPTGDAAAAPAAQRSPPNAGTPERAAKGADAPPRGRKPTSRVWVLRNGEVTPVSVKVGLSDGNATEVSGEDLEEGDEVIVGEMSAAAAAAGSTNPFAPQMFRGGGRGR
ncbi:MAG: efflux RND transporter periplasmic adaptor subunit [Planctomycetota bacterium]